MSILVNSQMRVLCQGITGYTGSFFSHRAIEFGTKIVGGVVPGKGGRRHLNLPVFDTVKEAKEVTGATATVLFVPPKTAHLAVMEAMDAEMELIVCVTEGIPILDMIKIKHKLKNSKSRLIGPNCPGIIAPRQCNIGIIPSSIVQPGRIGVVARSGTLLYEAVAQMCRDGLGQSTCIGIGADVIQGMSFVEALRLFRDDTKTDAVLLIGEIGGGAEEKAAKYLSETDYPKPVIAYVAGRYAPPHQRMGHSAAIVSAGMGGTEGKITALREAGVIMVESPVEFGSTVYKAVH